MEPNEFLIKIGELEEMALKNHPDVEKCTREAISRLQTLVYVLIADQGRKNVLRHEVGYDKI